MSLVSRLPEKVTRICLDLDDVLVDFEGAVETLFYGRTLRYKHTQFAFWSLISRNERNYRDKMWELINELGVDFWANLKKLPWADDLWEAASRVCNDVIILSSPGDSVAAEVAAQGKMRWCMREFGHNVLCLTNLKYMCACEDVLLIDDLSKFIKPWEDSGGVAIKLRKRWEPETVGSSPYEIIDALNKYAKK